MRIATEIFIMLIHTFIRMIERIALKCKGKKSGGKKETGEEREREREKEMMTMKYVPMYLCIIY